MVAELTPLPGHILYRAPGLDLLQRSDDLRLRMPAPAHTVLS
jgi:hypothetical protein